MSDTDTNQASEDELDEILGDLVYDTPNSYGYPPDFDPDFAKAKKNLKALIRTEKLKLLAEVRERVVGENEDLETIPPTMSAEYHDYVHAQNKLRGEQRYSLTQLEAEL